MKILGIDTSCDDTCAAVVEGTRVITSVVSSQISLHQPYGGVFPTVAKLAHQQNIAPVVALALKRAHVDPADLTAVAVTQGPGLAPALEVGLNFAKKFALSHHLPLIPINHLEGHLLSPLLQPHTVATPTPITFPCLAAVISGGHTQFVRVQNFGQYQVLGETLDDALGECLDKIGRLLNLGYPAGPVLEQLAKEGDPTKYKFPLPLTTRRDFQLSFSGLKTFARNFITDIQGQNPSLTKQQICDVAASAQTGVMRHLLYKLEKLWQTEAMPDSYFLVGGGVAANIYLRTQLRQLAKKYHQRIICPYHKRFCGDNAAMIAHAASYHYRANHLLPSKQQQALDRQPNLSLISWS